MNLIRGTLLSRCCRPRRNMVEWHRIIARDSRGPSLAMIVPPAGSEGASWTQLTNAASQDQRGAARCVVGLCCIGIRRWLPSTGREGRAQAKRGCGSEGVGERVRAQRRRARRSRRPYGERRYSRKRYLIARSDHQLHRGTTIWPPLALQHGGGDRWQGFLPVIPSPVGRWHRFCAR